jgi:hypothetical protein
MISGMTQLLAELAKDRSLLRPEPRVSPPEAQRSGSSLFGLAIAAAALAAVYTSTPADSRELPDCPIQSIGSCGSQ